MVQAIAQWRTIGGTRYESSADVAELVIQALTDMGPTEQGIDRVEFYVSVNGGAPVTSTVTAPEICYPNHAKGPSLLPGVSSDAMAPIPGYPLLLPMSSFADGTISVTATVFSNAGTSTPMDRPIVVYNNAGGTAPRPNTKEIWFDWTTGNDGNAGTEASPCKTLMGALVKARPNVSGSASADSDLHGARIYAKTGPQRWAGGFYGAPNLHTSGYGWVEVICATGCYFERTMPGGSVDPDDTIYPDTYLIATGLNGGGNFRIKFTSLTFFGAGGVIANSASVVTDCWIDIGLQSSHYFRAEAPWSVRFMEDQEQLMAFTNRNPNAKLFATRVLWAGLVGGPSEFFSVHDCIVTQFLGIALEPFDNCSFCNVIVENQRAYRDVVGRVRGLVPGGICTVPAAGQLRIDAVSSLTFTSEGDNHPMNLATLAEIANSTKFSVNLSGGWPPGNIGQWQVISAGTNGSGFGYVIVACPSAQAGTGTSTARIETWNEDANTADLYHADIMWMATRGGTHTRSLHYGVISRNIDSAQGFFQSITNLERVGFWNCRDGNNKADIINNLGGGTKNDCIFLNCTFGGVLTWPSGSPSGTFDRMNFVNCVVRAGNGISAAGPFISHNHFIASSIYGVNSSSGAPWFAGTYEGSPWDFTPTAGNFDTGLSTNVPWVADFAIPGSSGVTRGCFGPAVAFDFSLASSPDVTANAVALLPILATSSVSATIMASAEALLPILAQSASEVGIVANAEAVLPLVVDAFGTVLDADPGGEPGSGIGMAAYAEAILPLVATSTATAEVLADAVAILPMLATAVLESATAATVEAILPMLATGTILQGITANTEAVLPMLADSTASVVDEVTADAVAVLPLVAEGVLRRVSNVVGPTSDELRRERWEDDTHPAPTLHQHYQ